MVRSTTSRRGWRTLDSARIAAIAAAICVHVAALGVLTIPPTPAVAVQDAGADGTDGTDDYLHWVFILPAGMVNEHFRRPIYHDHRIGDLWEPTVDGSLEPIMSPAPTYPVDAFHEGVSGTVTLELLVGVDGRVLTVDIERTSGDRRLDRAAREQVLRRWRFRPTVRNGLPVQTLARVPVQFVLGDRQASPKR